MRSLADILFARLSHTWFGQLAYIVDSVHTHPTHSQAIEIQFYFIFSKVAAITIFQPKFKMKSVRNVRLAGNCIVRRMATTTQSSKQIETASTCPHIHPQIIENADTSAKANVVKRVENVRPYSEVPGPTPLPILGNTWRWVRNSNSIFFIAIATSPNLIKSSD